MSLKNLRQLALSSSFFQPGTLQTALETFAFVQADPIRAPARAQDLILRHRVKNYCAGDLEKYYPQLNLEEDVLYAYGFMPRKTWNLLHPRSFEKLSKLETQVFELVSSDGPTHPKALERALGKKRVVNNWGGHSQASTQALEALHYRGLLRVAKREKGIRVYETASPIVELSPEKRLRELILIVAKILAPVSQKTLQTQITRYKNLGNPKAALEDLLKSGELRQEKLDGVNYLFAPHKISLEEIPQTVKFLAPFDPLVWDRSRFEHFFGWQYRFEAYTPIAKRVRGYYAMPLLWGEEIIGWANLSAVSDKLNVQLGFIGKEPKDISFHAALDAEIARVAKFLQIKS